MTTQIISPVNFDNPPAEIPAGGRAIYSASGRPPESHYDNSIYTQDTINLCRDNDWAIFILSAAQWAAYPHSIKTIANNGDLILTAASDKPKRFAVGRLQHGVGLPVAAATKQLYHTQRQNDIDIAEAFNAWATLQEAGAGATPLQIASAVSTVRASAAAILDRDHESLHMVCSLFKSNLIGVLAAKPDGLHHSDELTAKASCLGDHLTGIIFIASDEVNERTGVHDTIVDINPAARIYEGRRKSPRAKQIAPQILGDVLDEQLVKAHDPATLFLDEHFERVEVAPDPADPFAEQPPQYRLSPAGAEYWNAASAAALELGIAAAERRITAAIREDDERAAAARAAAAGTAAAGE